MKSNVKEVKWWKWKGKDIFEPISILLFSYVFQTNEYSIHSDLVVPTEENMNKVNILSNFLGFFLYQIVGIFGYIAFPINTPGNIINGIGMPDEPKYQSVLVGMSYVILGITIVFAYPMNSIPLRYTVRRMFISDDAASDESNKCKVKLYTIISTLIVCVCINIILFSNIINCIIL